MTSSVRCVAADRSSPLLAGCASAPTTRRLSHGQTPRSICARYFDGALECHGMFTDRAGKVQRRFSRADGRDAGAATGVLDEDFTLGRTARPSGASGR